MLASSWFSSEAGLKQGLRTGSHHFKAVGLLARFGVGMVETMLQARGGTLIVIENKDVPGDLVRDMTGILTCFCARLYGKRSAADRARRAMESVSG